MVRRELMSKQRRINDGPPRRWEESEKWVMTAEPLERSPDSLDDSSLILVREKLKIEPKSRL